MYESAYVIILVTGMNLSAIFSHSSPTTLQKEIQVQLNITDSQFNNFYSAKAVSGMFIPFLTAIMSERIGLEYMTLAAGVINAVGTYLFVLGISHSEY